MTVLTRLCGKSIAAIMPGGAPYFFEVGRRFFADFKKNKEIFFIAVPPYELARYGQLSCKTAPCYLKIEYGIILYICQWSW